MEAGGGTSIGSEETQTHKVSPLLPQKLWLKTMRCDEMVHSEKGDGTHHTRNGSVIRSPENAHGNTRELDKSKECLPAKELAGSRKD